MTANAQKPMDFEAGRVGTMPPVRETLSGPQAQEKPDVVVRELPAEEFELLSNYHPFSEFGLPNPDLTRVVVAQRVDNGDMVAMAFVSPAVHVEPVWVAEEHRGRPGLIRRFWRKVRDILVEAQVATAFSVINDVDIPRGVLAQNIRLGLMKVPGNLYVLNVANPQFDPDASRPVDVRKE